MLLLLLIGLVTSWMMCLYFSWPKYSYWDKIQGTGKLPILSHQVDVPLSLLPTDNSLIFSSRLLI